MNLCRFLLLGILAGVPYVRAELPWMTDMTEAKSLAAIHQKCLIMEFTGSDWCSACKRLEAEVLSSPEFADYAGGFILVRLDYPVKKQLAPELKKQNEALKNECKVEAFPTVIMTDALGHEIHRAVGYLPGSGPDAYLALLTGEKQPSPHY
jgi:thioredoxin-related protein